MWDTWEDTSHLINSWHYFTDVVAAAQVWCSVMHLCLAAQSTLQQAMAVRCHSGGKWQYHNWITRRRSNYTCTNTKLSPEVFILFAISISNLIMKSELLNNSSTNYLKITLLSVNLYLRLLPVWI